MGLLCFSLIVDDLRFDQGTMIFQEILIEKLAGIFYCLKRKGEVQKIFTSDL